MFNEDQHEGLDSEQIVQGATAAVAIAGLVLLGIWMASPRVGSSVGSLPGEGGYNRQASHSANNAKNEGWKGHTPGAYSASGGGGGGGGSSAGRQFTPECNQQLGQVVRNNAGFRMFDLFKDNTANRAICDESRR